jgi:hypothetical protein
MGEMCAFGRWQFEVWWVLPSRLKRCNGVTVGPHHKLTQDVVLTELLAHLAAHFAQYEVPQVAVASHDTLCLSE